MKEDTGTNDTPNEAYPKAVKALTHVLSKTDKFICFGPWGSTALTDEEAGQIFLLLAKLRDK